MAGKPVIMSIDAGNDIVSEAGCGISVPFGNSKSVADAIRQLLYTSDHERSRIGLAGKRYIMHNHTYQGLSRKFLSGIVN